MVHPAAVKASSEPAVNLGYADIVLSPSGGFATVFAPDLCDIGDTIPYIRSHEVFAFTAIHISDIDQDNVAEIAFGSPPDGSGESNGSVTVYSPLQREVVWTFAGPAGYRTGYVLIEIPDQNHDYASDILVASYDDFGYPYTFVLCGATGDLLRIIQGCIHTTIAQIRDGATAFRATDVNGSGSIDVDDVIYFIEHAPTQCSTLDINQDGSVCSSDLIGIIDDLASELLLVQDESASWAAPGPLWEAILWPENLDPILFQSLVYLDYLARNASIEYEDWEVAFSSAVRPETVAQSLVAIMTAMGYTEAQMVAILLAMGFSIAIIVLVLGVSEGFVQAVEANTRNQYCRQLRESYKSACDTPGCGSVRNASPSKCDEYRLNYLANINCAQLRQRHFDHCIPSWARDVWDPNGGHMTQIRQKTAAAINCINNMVAAGCSGIPQVPNVPGVGLPNRPPVGEQCTVGIIGY